MDRIIHKELVNWKNKPNRKPLLVQGARQVGKTYAIKAFGKSDFSQCIYLNFDENPEYKDFFKNTKEVSRIITNIELAFGVKIEPENTLLFFDEIQECNEALNTLKYFYENHPEYYVCCAGSLLGVALSRGNSFPVGKVDFCTMYPLTFEEFLQATDLKLFTYYQKIERIEPIPSLFFNQLEEKFKIYILTGGMPEAILTYTTTKNTEQVQTVLQNILRAYSLDFSKYSSNKDVVKILHIWNSIPSQLAKENKKFLYQTVKSGARAREYEDALNWLVNAGLVYKIYRSNKPAFPVSAYDDLNAFKIYLLDVGLLRRFANLDPSIVLNGHSLYSEFKGSLIENYVLQSLLSQTEEIPRYWTSENTAEVDFMLPYKNEIIPIEVKSGENVKSKSLSIYRKNYEPRISLRFSLKNLNFDDGLLNIPLFLVDKTFHLLEKL
ncbi:MAG: ATP-binding protein [Crocinitomicaceae bacterium]|jgi:predicted AAA+ superfamily ATPase